MRKFILLLLGMMVGFAVSNAAVVYFDNSSSSWTTPYIHYYGGSDATSWPGKAMTKVDGTANIWKCDVGNNNTANFHNNSGTQTKNTNLSDRRLYKYNGDNAASDVGAYTSPSYTVYYYSDSENDNADKYVYAWKGDDKIVGAWDSSIKMTSTNKYIKKGDKYYPCWKYTFTSDVKPANILFKTTADDSGSQLTGDGTYGHDAAFVDNGFYTKGTYQNVENSLSLVDKATSVSYTVYYYSDSETDNADKYLYVWNGGTTIVGSWESSVKMTPTNKYIKKGDKYYPCWTHTFTSTVEPKNLIVKDAANAGTQLTGGGTYGEDATFVNNGFYTKGTYQTVESGLSLVNKDVVNPGNESEYYVYFRNNNKWSNVYAWAWNGGTNCNSANSFPGDKMEYDASTGLWKWSLPEGKTVPLNIIFAASDKGPQTNTLRFVNHATYNVDGTYDRELRPDEARPNVLYFHWKTDRAERGGSDNVVPKCHVFKNGTATQLHEFGSAAEEMTKVDDVIIGDGKITTRYEIWKYEIPEADFNAGTYDNATFYLPTENNKHQWSTNGGNGANRSDYLKKNWTKYIYATATSNDVNFACPTYITYGEFKELHNKAMVNLGRDDIFVVGPRNDFKWYDENDGEHQFNGYDLLKCDRMTPDDGVFYLKLKPAATNTDNENAECQGNKFKLSWIDVATNYNEAVATEGGVGDEGLAGNRKWATFDLGSIGIDEHHSLVVSTNAFDRNRGPAGRTKVNRNVSLPYVNYNQCDWLIDQSSDNRWLIIDTHSDENDENYQCMSVTVTSFDPHPSLTAEITELKNDGSAAELNTEHRCLKASVANDHIDLDALNYAVAKVSISGADINNVVNSTFSRLYEMTFNGETFGSVNGALKNITMNYFPIDIDGYSYDGSAVDRGVKIRARYTDVNTHLKFHSRTGAATVSGVMATPPAPEEVSLTGKYIEEKLEYTSLKDKNPKRTFGVFVRGFNNSFTPEKLTGYADYEVLDEYGNDITAKCKLFKGTDNQLLRERIGQNFPESYNELCWTSNHWSSDLKESENEVPLYFETINDTPVKDVTELGTRKYTILLHAVYPFVYDPNAHFDEAQLTTAAAGRASESTKRVAHAIRTTSLELIVDPAGTVTGVDSVLGDADADAPVEYYTISGVRVDNPTPGIYVRRQGNSVEKVVIR